MAAPLLDINTLVESRHVRIDGAMYKLAGPLQLPFFTNARLAWIGERAGDILEKGHDATKDERGEFDALVREGVSLVLEAPPDVLAKLTDASCFSILTVFGAFPSGRATAGETGARSRIGASNSRGSKSGTAGRRRNGARASR